MPEGSTEDETQGGAHRDRAPTGASAIVCRQAASGAGDANRVQLADQWSTVVPETLTRIAQQGEALGYDYLDIDRDYLDIDRSHRAAEHAGAGVAPIPRAANFLERARNAGTSELRLQPTSADPDDDAVVTSPFAERGRVTDEYLSAMRNLWTEEAPRFDGRWARFGGISFEPKPVQKPHPPIWVAVRAGSQSVGPPGWATPGVRSAATTGLLDTLPRYRAGVDRLRDRTAEAGRLPASVALTYRVKRYGEAVPPKASDGERRLFSGSTPDIVDDLKALRALGV